MTELVLGLLDKGGAGIGALIVIGLGFLIKNLLARRASLMSDLRKDLIAAKAENRELEAELDSERQKRRTAEDQLWQCRNAGRGRHRPDSGGWSR